MCVCLARARSGAQRRAAALCVRYARSMCAPCLFALSLRALCIYAAQARPQSIVRKSRPVSAPCAFPARFVRSAGLSPSGCVIVPPYTRKARKRAKNGRCGAFVVFLWPWLFAAALSLARNLCAFLPCVFELPECLSNRRAATCGHRLQPVIREACGRVLFGRFAAEKARSPEK